MGYRLGRSTFGGAGCFGETAPPPLSLRHRLPNGSEGRFQYQAACWQTNNFTEPGQELTANFGENDLNVSRFTSPTITKAFETGRSSSDTAERKAAYATVSQEVATELPYA